MIPRCPISSLPFDISSSHDAGSDDLEELAAVFAVEALTPEENHEYLEHLRVCQICRSLAGQFQQAANVLPDILPIEPASPGLKPRILDEARADVERSTFRTPPLSSRRRHPLKWRWPAWLSPIPATAVAVLAIAIAGLLIWNITLQQEINDQERILLQHQQVIDTLAAGGEIFHIPGTDAAPQATAVLVREPGGERAILIVDGLPSLPSEMGYQVWRIRDESVAPVGAGTYSIINSDVYGVAISATFSIIDAYAHLVVVADNFSAADALGVSVEPIEGSVAPTGDIVLLGEL